MSDISPILEQFRLFVGQHVPPNMLSKVVPVAVACLLAGVALSVFGAKLARFGFSAAFVLLGGFAGHWFAGEFGYPALPCALVGGVMIGTIGHMTHRLWVGVVTAVVLSLLALGFFGFHRIAPHLPEFNEKMVAGYAVNGTAEVALSSPKEQEAYLDRSRRQWAQGLWQHITAKDVHLERQGKALAIVVLIAGLCVGVVVGRWMLVLATSLLGTGLVTLGVATLCSRVMPESYQAFAGHPGMVGIGVGGFLVTSLIVQTLLTRKAPSTAPVSDSPATT